jgi:nucleoid DNA-binding protein
MTKSQLIDTLATKSGSDKKSAKAVLEGLTALVTDTLKKGGEVKLQDLGKFKVVNRKARVGRNPQTGEPIKIPAKKAVKFYLAKSLRDIAKK